MSTVRLDHDPSRGSAHRSPISAIAALAIVLVGALLVTVVMLAGGASAKTSPARAAASTVSIKLSEFKVKPSPASTKAGTVTFRVKNAGKAKHEFVVLKTGKKASKLLKGAEANEAGNLGEIGNVPSGATKTLKLKLKAGHYALLCNLPGHYKAGQYVDFTVR